MSRILLAGWYGMQNSGDDALLAVSAWGARRFFKAVTLRATAAQIPLFPGSSALIPVQVPATRFKGENRLRLLWAAARSSGVIFGGGSVFHSTDDMKRMLELLRFSGPGPRAALGVSVGPFRDSRAEAVCTELLKRLDFVGLRDQESFEIVSSISPGVRHAKTFDLAPLLPRMIAVPGKAASLPRRGIGFALCDYERFVGRDAGLEAQRRDGILDLIERLDPDLVGEIVFIDFNGHACYGDRPVHQEIAARISPRFKVRHVPYTPDPGKVLEIIAGLRCIVAMRLHAAIFSFMARTPTLLLSYHNKCRGWASEIGLPGRYLHESVGFDAAVLAACVMDGLESSFETPNLSVDEAEDLSLLNWSWFGA